MRPYRLLFVCMGNICRSPAAEAVMRHLVESGGLAGRIECASAGTLAIARAGHCPALMIRRDGTTEYLRPDGLALGLDRSGLFGKTLQEAKVNLAPGDVCLLYTDGVVEARNASGEQYGYDRLAAAASRECPASR